MTKTQVMRTHSPSKVKSTYVTVSSILLASAFILWPNVPSAISPSTSISSESDQYSPLQITFPLDKYAMVMSSVPGFPIEIREENTSFPLTVTASSGKLLVMDGSPGTQVRLSGTSLEVKQASIIYWSPLASPPVKETTITVTSRALRSNSAAGSASVHIVQDHDGFYKIN
ncbi:hypothetical protein BK126_15555 [Paenibacillus sp. FSL H7-0326]|uniref:hypothetical protein n=1 Tax=Paenibacillus sp. FSL H7-0326 TaxID=1921144 RepID=UPI00096DA680|nr:hypothetical protein [Paenibacillus sp. FSL H7-0326]OMC69175.1 hypothetical protein BK126_15555 [Paenibacillus sp. FSL H7-0326]